MKYGFLICGPSGIGKSSNVEKMIENAGLNKKDFLIIDPDLLKGTHTQQSTQALENVYLAIMNNQSFIYIATCGGTKIIMDILFQLKTNKFQSVVAIIYTSLPTSLKRISQRSEQPVPEDVVKDLHQFFNKKAERFMTLPNIDQIYLFNNETNFNLLLSRKSKKIICSSSSNDNNEFYFDISKYC
jgi:predicted ABC-type ATPase